MVHSSLLHRLAHALLVAVIVALVAAGTPAQSAQATEKMHMVVGQVFDEAAAAVPNPCPDVLELVTGFPSPGPPTPMTVECLARAAAQGVRLPKPGTPCSGAHVATGTSVVVRDGDHRVLAQARLHSGHVSDSSLQHCVFTFSVQVPSRAAYFFLLSRDRWVSYTAGELRNSQWHAGLEV
jgi:hypothetical protein